MCYCKLPFDAKNILKYSNNRGRIQEMTSVQMLSKTDVNTESFMNAAGDTGGSRFFCRLPCDAFWETSTLSSSLESREEFDTLR